MITFTDGPAENHALPLRRSPCLLRVTHDGKNFDGLDQPGDRPNPNEKLYAYRMSKYEGQMHVRAARGAGGFYPMATYRLFDPQPDDATMRDNAKWAAWAEVHGAAIKVEMEAAWNARKG